MDRHHAHPADGNAWYAATVQETLDGLQTSYQGLTAAEAEKRLQKFGPNTLAGAEKKGPLTRFILQFHNILIYVLLAAAVITAFLQEWIDCLVIFGVTIINALIGFIQEGKAEKSLDSIRNMLAPRATVLRDGKKSTIPAEDLVPGDLVLLQPGDRVPADLRLFELRDLQIDESALTGESVAVNKDIHALEENEVLAERSNMAFSGTMVTYGQGRGVVASTGKSTEIGRISSMLSRVDTLKTPLLKQMDAFGRKLTAAILVLAGLTFVFGTAIRDFGAGEMFLAAVGLAVAAIPEGLPAIMTITLAIGVQKMARRKAIIRRLPAVETLGSVTIICSDKTGTLTKNEMTVQNISTADRLFQITGAGYSPQGEFVLDGEKISPAHHPLLLQLLKATLLCNNATIQKDNEQWKVDGAPTEGALLTAAAKAGLDQNEMNKAMPRLDIIPFSSEKKFMATLNRTKEDKTEIILKGAPERILDRCTAQRHQDGDRPLDRGFWEQQGEVMASGGQRLLALAVKEMDRDRQDIPESDLEDGFVFLGLFGIIDPPREEAVEAAARLIGKCVSVHECHSAGIRVKMITGDHSLTALSIAKKLGIGDGKTALSGQDLEQMSDESLRQVAPEVDVFARTSPEHKLRLVQALQGKKHVVAMTGDGVNDAPALKRADIGVAMGLNGTEAAREASDMVLADNNFASIANAVEEGRTVYDNLKKAILFILPTNGGEALTVIASILLGIGLADGSGHFSLPITPPQILWINMVTAVTLALTLAFEAPEANVMRRPPRPPEKGLISGFLLWRVSFVSLLLVIGTLGHYQLTLLSGASQNLAGTAAVNTLVAGQVFYLFNSRHILEPSWTRRGRKSARPALLAVAVLAVFQLGFTYLPAMQYLFGTEPLGAGAWLKILVFGLALFLVVEIEKAVLRGLRTSN